MSATDAELIDRIAGGDTAALEDLYRRHVDRVVAFGAARCRDAHEVADLTAAVWISVWESAGTYDSNRGEAIAWIVGIASNRFVDIRRGERRADDLLDRLAGHRFLDTDDIERLSEQVDAARSVSAAGDLLSRLPKAQRSVFQLVALDGLTSAEAAAVLGSTPTAVRMRLTRARRTLRHAAISAKAPQQPNQNPCEVLP